MKPQPKDLTICIVDYGAFTYFAERLAPHFKKVFVTVPRESGFAKTDRDDICSGISGVERLSWPDFWKRIDEVQVVWFPFINQGWMAEHLRSIGKKVISTFGGEMLERDRDLFKQTLVNCGLPVIPYKEHKEGLTVFGWDALRTEMKNNENFWVKMSDFRGIEETHCVRNYSESERWLFEVGHLLCSGGRLNTFPFHLEDNVKAEEGGDDLFFNGKKFLDRGLQSIEDKDSGCLSKVVNYKDLPFMFRNIHERTLPVFQAYGIQSPVSTEIRVVNKRLGYYNDATQRVGSPPGEIMCEIFDNLPEILVAMAYGEDIMPVASKKYGASIFLYSERLIEEATTVLIPFGIKRWVKLQSAMKQDGQYICMPMDKGSVLGAAVGLGNTIVEAETNALAVADQIKADGIYYSETVFDRIEATLDKAKALGVGF